MLPDLGSQWLAAIRERRQRERVANQEHLADVFRATADECVRDALFAVAEAFEVIARERPDEQVSVAWVASTLRAIAPEVADTDG